MEVATNQAEGQSPLLYVAREAAVCLSQINHTRKSVISNLLIAQSLMHARICQQVYLDEPAFQRKDAQIAGRAQLSMAAVPIAFHQSKSPALTRVHQLQAPRLLPWCLPPLPPREYPET